MLDYYSYTLLMLHIFMTIMHVALYYAQLLYYITLHYINHTQVQGELNNTTLSLVCNS